jgi:predicted nucleic acid-binding protein
VLLAIVEKTRCFFNARFPGAFMKRFYVDTGIWLDFALNRKNHIRPLGDLAFQFFKKCIREQWQVLYSDAVLEELGKKLTPSQIEERCFKIILAEGLLLKVCFSGQQVEEAERTAQSDRLPFIDALHAVIARDNDAVIVSRNFHFERLLKIVKVSLPEEI